MEGRSSPRVKVRDIHARIRRRGFLFTRNREEIARVFKIGPKGLSLECEYPLHPDTRLALILLISDKRTIRCAGIVRNLRKTQEGYIVGVEFTRLSNRDKGFLSGSILDIGEVNVLGCQTTLKDRIRKLRTAMQLTRSELADLASVPARRIVEIEFGIDKAPSEDMIQRIAVALGIPEEELIGDESDTKEGTTAEALKSRTALP